MSIWFRNIGCFLLFASLIALGLALLALALVVGIGELIT